MQPDGHPDLAPLCVKKQQGVGSGVVAWSASNERWSLNRADSVTVADLEEHLAIGGTLKGC